MTRNNNLKTLWIKTIILIVISSLFTSLFFLWTSLLFNESEEVFVGSRVFQELELYWRIIILIVLLVVWLTTEYLSGFYKNKLLTMLILNYKEKINLNIVNNSKKHLQNSEIGELQNGFLNDAEMVKEQYYKSLLTTIQSSVTILFTFITIVLLSYWMIVLIIGLSVLMYLVSLLLKKPLSKKNEEISNLAANYNTSLLSLLKGLSTFYSYNKLNNFEKKSNEINETYENANYKLNFKVALWNSPLNILSIAVMILTYVIGAILISKNLMNEAALVAISMVSYDFMNSVEKLLANLVTHKSTKVIYKKYDNDKEINQENKLSILNTIVYENVEVKYGDKIIIENFNATIEKNKKYLIVGESGSGKSSLVKTLIGINDISSGTLKYNGEVIHQKNIHDLRNNIAYIEQEIYLFDNSLAYNIALSDDYDEVKIRKILNQVNLTKFLNFDLKTNIGGDLEKISGGEKRRIGLARALYANKDLFIVDETTSNLDLLTKDAIEKLILEQKNKTIVMIAHDLSVQNQNLIDEVIKL